MEFDWSTLVLEVINFLILVWLLKRFLYQPVLNMIEKRRQKIEAELAQAAKGQEEAELLKKQYEERLTDWEREKRGSLDELAQQIEQERSKLMQQLDEELEQQRLKNRARDQQQQTQWRSQAEVEALQLGGAFVAQTLKALAGPELNQRLQQLFVDQLAGLSESAMQQLREGWQEGSVRVEVASALPLNAAAQQLIRQALEQKLGHSDGEWQFSCDDKLIAGLRVSIGGWMLHANLQDELHFFSEAAASHG